MMKMKPWHALFACAALALSIGNAAARDDDDECKAGTSLRLVNGRIHTMDKHDKVVSSVLITNGRFAAVGGDARRDGDDCARTIDLRGRTVVPGVIDNHNHILLLGLRPGRDARLENANSIKEALDTLAARAKEKDVKPGEWITSIGGFSRNQFFPAPQATRFPTLKELSDAVPGNPVFIMEGFSGPGATNEAGRKWLTDHNVPLAADGTCSATTVSPDGTTVCTMALNRLRGLQTRESMLQGLRDAQRYAAGIGLTTHLDQGGFPSVGNDSDGAANFDRYRAHDSLRTLFHEPGGITNRIWINFLHLETDPQTPELMARLLNAWNDFGDDMVHVVGIGEFTAGPFLEPGTPQWFHGTRLVADAQWRNENHSLNFPAPLFPVPGPADWKVIIEGWEKVNAEKIADDLKAGRNGDGITKLRWVLAHLPFVDDDHLHLTRLKNLGAGVSVLGGWRWLSGTPRTPTRAPANGPQFKKLLDSGIPLGMSSDGMQISTMSPWINLYYVVTGKNARGEVINIDFADQKYGDQTLGRKDAIRLYTANNGWFLNAEDKLGTIEEGKLGDLVVLSADYFDERAVPNESIKDLRSVLTVVGGKVVYDDLDGRSKDYWKAGMP